MADPIIYDVAGDLEVVLIASGGQGQLARVRIDGGVELVLRLQQRLPAGSPRRARGP
jgi:hypothetical protein